MAEKDDALPEYTQKWWMKEIEASEKFLDDEWRESASRVVDRYLDKRTDSSRSVDDDGAKKYNIFWANVQIIKSALYATPPKPKVTRQHGDAKDDVARTAALILERMLTFDLENDDSDMHEAFNQAIEDRLIPGLGQVWLRYDVKTEKTPAVQDPNTGEQLAPEGMRITEENVRTEYVHWRDFVYSVSRTWGEVWWLGRRTWLKKKAFIQLFSKEKWAKVKEAAAGEKEKEGKTPKGFTRGRVEVFEIWCEESNKVYWLNRHLDDLLAEKDDPLGLEKFYPCPKPIIATHTTNKFVPRSDYTMVADQYEELDILNDRIATLTKALRVVGVYDKEQAELSKLLSGGEFNMIAVDNWAALAEKGGLKGTVDWFPVDIIAEVLERLMQQRQAVIAQIYELTSISDIMRGATNARETLGAQKLKAQYSSVRLQLNQQDVGKFVRQALRIKTEIICLHFQPETIAKVSQIEFTESVNFAQPAIQLLKDYENAEYRIEVQEQSLSIADYTAEREQRTELLTAVGQFLSQSAALLEGMPQALPYILKMIAWVIASFNGASDIETVFDEAIASAKQMPPQNKNGDQGAQAQAQAKMQTAQVAAQSAGNIAQISARKDLQKTQMEIASKEKIAHEQNQTAVVIEEMKEGQAQQELLAEVTGIKADLAQSQAKLAVDVQKAAQDRQAQASQADAQRAHEAGQADAQRSAAQRLQDTKPKGK